MSAQPPDISYRFATDKDCGMLAELNHQLIRDEGHRNPMTVPQLEQRMGDWLATGEYRAVIFQQGGTVVAYALYKEDPDQIYLRHFFVVRDRRRRGVGRQGIEVLRNQIWPRDKWLTVSVLVRNPSAIAFWRAVGYVDYSLKLEIRPAADGNG